MTDTNFAVEVEPLSSELAIRTPSAAGSDAAFMPAPTSTAENLEGDAGILEWVTDLSWHQVLPIATVACTLLMGLMLYISFFAFGG